MEKEKTMECLILTHPGCIEFVEELISEPEGFSKSQTLVTRDKARDFVEQIKNSYFGSIEYLKSPNFTNLFPFRQPFKGGFGFEIRQEDDGWAYCTLDCSIIYLDQAIESVNEENMNLFALVQRITKCGDNIIFSWKIPSRLLFWDDEEGSLLVPSKEVFTKRALTLIEMMIVILLITLVTGVVGYNMKGALDRGKAFRTEAAREKLADLLTLISSEQPEWNVVRLAGLDPKDLGEKLTKTGLVRNPDEVLKDGWGHYFRLEPSTDRKSIRIVSSWYANYQERTNHKSINKEDNEDNEF